MATAAVQLQLDTISVVSGDFTVNGDTTIINSTTMTVDDKNIVVASGAADSSHLVQDLL